MYSSIIFPLVEDLPVLARPFTAAEKEKANDLAKQSGLAEIEKSSPISVVGTGVNLKVSTDYGPQRAANLLGMSIPEVRNRATINGAIEIGRHPGVLQITFLAPLHNLEKAGLLALVQEQYDIL